MFVLYLSNQLDNCTAGTLMQFRVGNKLKNEYLHGVVPTKQMYNYDKARPDHTEVSFCFILYIVTKIIT